MGYGGMCFFFQSKQTMDGAMVNSGEVGQDKVSMKMCNRGYFLPSAVRA